MPFLRPRLIKQHSVLPGFSLTLGFSVFYLLLVVLVPLAGLLLKTSELSWQQYIAVITAPRVMAAYRVSFGLSLLAALINTLMGLIIAWVLVRYRPPFKRLLDAMIDLPFALPTAVAGIALSSIYAPKGIMGSLLAPFGIRVAFHPAGIAIALIFVGIPFVVRTVEPVLQDMEREVEEAAHLLGANRWQIFTRVVLPYILPALLTGFAMAFARGLGEYGSVIFIAGNMPMVSEVVPLLIVTKLEQYDYAGAAAIATTMLGISFILLLSVNVLQRWSGSRRSM